MKIFWTASLLIFMILVGRLDAAITKKAATEKVAKKALGGKSKQEKASTKASERALSDKGDRKLALFDGLSNLLDYIIILIIVLYVWQFLNDLLGTNMSSSSKSRKLRKADKSHGPATEDYNQKKAILQKEVLNLPKNKDFPKFFRRLKADIFHILDKKFQGHKRSPSVSDAFKALSPYLTKKFYYKKDGFKRLKSGAENLLDFVKKNPSLVPGFMVKK